ncbi:hypothetical protein ABMA28_004477 [Loxostege sticticalis]|uniref:Uncharacterized protein n=1 Tax=Loxostege sticticalis TaxID=481309 RepID=A0ABD0SRB6_LOXSC
MAGVLFIVTVPQKDYENELRKKEKSTNIVMEKEKYEKASKIIHELKKSRRFGSIKPVESYASDDDSSITASKCTSTDCLHTHDGLYRCKSENTLDEVRDGGYLKSPWGDVKQVMKAKRNKVNITRPVRGVDILGAFHWDTPLETILSEILERLDITCAAWNATRDDKFWKVTFSLKSGNLTEELLQVLRTLGIGSRYQSSMSILPCNLFYQSSKEEEETSCKDDWKRGNSAWSKFSSSVRARNNLAQVLHVVRAEASLTFDWLFLLLVAAFVSAIGLVEDSTVIIVASMLISPLMGPITAATLGTAVRDRSLQHMGLLHEMLGLFLSLVLGFIFGLTICAVDDRYGVGEWPTEEMTSRCEIRSLWVGVLVAIPSGAGVALAVLSEYTASLVGVAISASLLPPAVNAGLLWSMALVHLIFAEDETRFSGVITSFRYSEDPATELALLGTVSLCLTLVNILCIFLSGVAVYKVKEVCPLERRDITWWRAIKNPLQSPKIIEKDPAAPWDMYSKWCADQIEAQTPDKVVSPVQSDTVTYRRHVTGFRPKAQNIEDYLQKAPTADYTLQNSDSQSTLDVESRTSNQKEDDEKCEKPSRDSSLYCNEKSICNLKSLDPQDFSFYNASFEENEIKTTEESDKTPYPTLEPSSNLTVDAKQHGIVLGNKSFHV